MTSPTSPTSPTSRTSPTSPTNSLTSDDDRCELVRHKGVTQAVPWGIVCGSGVGRGLLGHPALALDDRIDVSFAELGFPVADVQGHGSELVFGRLGSTRVCFQTGRLHPYEGHAMDVVTAPLRLMLKCGVERVVLTCAVGGLLPNLVPGSLALLRDQINLWGPTPLVGPRFVDCAEIYDPAMRATVRQLARARGLIVPEVVYAHARGPQYETPAETEALRRLGAEIVGMSTTYEAILAHAEGASVTGIAVVTNAAGATGLTHLEVQQRSAAAVEALGSLLGELVQGAE